MIWQSQLSVKVHIAHVHLQIVPNVGSLSVIATNRLFVFQVHTNTHASPRIHLPRQQQRLYLLDHAYHHNNLLRSNRIRIEATMNPETITTKKIWRKRFLVPLWVVELLATGIFFIVACVVLSYANDPDVEVAGYRGYFV